MAGKPKGFPNKRPKSVETKERSAQASSFSLSTQNQSIDPQLSSLFAVRQPPVKPQPVPTETERSTIEESNNGIEENDADLSELGEDEIEKGTIELEIGSEAAEDYHQPRATPEEIATGKSTISAPQKRKRKRRDADDDLESTYMDKLGHEEDKESRRIALERSMKRQKPRIDVNSELEREQNKSGSSDDGDEVVNAGDLETSRESAPHNQPDLSPPPKHETEHQADEELAKANRTVFVGNVSTAAIKDKSARKTLLNHLGSFFSELPVSKDGNTKHKVESIRFRSTPYASAIPKKAAFAKQELMDETSKSTNAYAVYSSPLLAREAAKRLNASVVLDRHLRVDEIAHPAKVDHRRCVFVGNLGFVDDESNIQDANEEEGREKRKRGKEPADVEEGLWRTFGKCGKVESVRVIRDSTTRVGKGIAYVQFEDENAVEAALLYNEKKLPPMLPRKLRVSRAKAQKRNAKPGSGRPSASVRPAATSYQRKLTGEEASMLGRRGKLLGRAAAAQARKPGPAHQLDAREVGPRKSADGIKSPENFIFEGHRASAKQGKSGLRLAGKHAKKNNVTKRSASFRAKKNKTAS